MSLNYQPKAQTQAVKDRRKKFQTKVDGESLTVQADKDRCCVNKIVAQYRKTGLVTHVANAEGRYVDVVDAGDFQEAMNTVAYGQQSFEALPSDIRKRFNNDPVEFFKFATDAENIPELIKLGLAEEVKVENDGFTSETMPKEQQTPSESEEQPTE